MPLISNYRGREDSVWEVSNVGIGTTVNVGIGTTAPTTKLDVIGNASISGVLTVNQIDVNGISTDGVNFGTLSYIPIADGSGGWDWGDLGSIGGLSSIFLRDEGTLVGTSGTVTTLDIKGNNVTATGIDGTGIGTITVSDTPTFDTLNVSSASTFSSIDVNGGLTANSAIVEDLTDNRVVIVGAGGELEDDANLTFDGSYLTVGTALTVTGIGSFGTDLYVDGNLEVVGNINYTDATSTNLSVVGLSTFDGLIDINAGGQANSFKVEDLTDNRVVIVGTGGELEDDANLTFDGSTLTIGVGLDVDGHTELDNVNVSGVSTFQTSIFQDDITIGIGTTVSFFDVSTGQIGIGTTNPETSKVRILENTNNYDTLLVESGASTDPFGIKIDFSASAPDNQTEYFLLCQDNLAVRARIYSSGEVWTSDAGVLTSDETLKNNIVDATSKLEDVKRLRVRNFNWNEEFSPGKVDKKMIGFIAQEIEEVFPGLVTEHNISSDGENPVYKKAVKEAKLVPILTKALQEAIARIESQDETIASLESRITALEQQ